MGAWGSGPFENDDALDFVSEITSVDDLVREVAFEDVGDKLEADRASRALVVGECVAAMRGHPIKDMPEDLIERVLTFGMLSPELFENTRDSISMVISSSELAELWGESDDRGAFNRSVTDLIERLNQPAGKPNRPSKRKPKTNPSPCLICDKEMGAEFTSFDITLEIDYGISEGGSVHLACLNAALHPKYIIQNWKFDEDEVDALVDGILGDENSD